MGPYFDFDNICRVVQKRRFIEGMFRRRSNEKQENERKYSVNVLVMKETLEDDEIMVEPSICG